MPSVQCMPSRIRTAKETLSRIRILSGNQIKMIAVLFMLFDHTCKILWGWVQFHGETLAPFRQMPEWQFTNIDNFIRFTLYPIGATAFPLFCFFVAEGFWHTKNRKRYMGTMLLFALLTELPFDVGFFRELAIRDGTFPFYWAYQNVLFTLLLGLAALWCIEKWKCTAENRTAIVRSTLLQAASVAGLAWIAELIHADYGAHGVLLIVAFSLCRRSRLGQMVAFLAVYILSTGCQPMLAECLAIFILLLYNGQRANGT